MGSQGYLINFCPLVCLYLVRSLCVRDEHVFGRGGYCHGARPHLAGMVHCHMITWQT